MYQQTESWDVTWRARNTSWRRFAEEKRRRISNIPERMRDLSLDDLPDTVAGRKVQEWCERWGKFPDSGLPVDDFTNNRGRGLWLVGEPGRGKTTMAVIAANHLSDLGWSTMFRTVADLYDLTLRPMNVRDEVERERLTSAYDCYDAGWNGWRLVVLDDLGKEHKTASGWAQDNLDSLLRNRFNSAAPTIVTTNITVEELGGIYNPSLQSFIHEAFVVVLVTGKDRRDPRRGH